MFIAGTLICVDNSFGEEVVIWNDQFPIKVDFSIGAFGSGKLYFDGPLDVAVDEDENVFVLDAGNRRVQVFDKEGKFKTFWKLVKSNSGYFERGGSLAISPEDSSVYVLDTERCLVTKYDTKGNFILSFGKSGFMKGSFDFPVDLTVDRFGYIYVLDKKRSKVLKWHENGTFVKEWGDKGIFNSDFSEPVSITFGNELLGFIYVLDNGKRTLIQFSTDGLYKNAFSLDILSEGISKNLQKVDTDDRGTLFILDGGLSKLVQFKNNMFNVYKLMLEGLSLGPLNSLAVSKDEHIYVTDVKHNKIHRFVIDLN